jgi:lysophospholipase L1-like esterase
LNYDPSRGQVKAPLLLWGPYLWADGVKPRSDGLVWKREDLAGDGTHPSASGRRKVAQLLLDFFKNDDLAKGWFGK